LNDIKALIEKPYLSAIEKILIVDKFKTIFSYILNLTDGKEDGQNLAALADHRGSTYKTMK